MLQAASTETGVAGSSAKNWRETAAHRLSRMNKVSTLGLASFVAGVAVMLMYRPFLQMESGDNAIWDYISQSILRGQIPYRDVIENKSPGSAYLSALVMYIGELFGISDIIAVRLFYVVLVGLLCAVTYLVAERYLRSRVAGVIAPLIPLMSEKLAMMLVAGTRPKLPMILFGMICLYLIAIDRPFWAGLVSMLACLCWQPGLLFTGVAFLIFSRYLSRWRDLRALKVVLGAAVPLSLNVFYFYSRDALGDLWRWTIAYNFSVYMPEGREEPAVSMLRLWSLLDETMADDFIWVKLSLIGMLLFAVKRLWPKLRKESGPFGDAILLAPLIYVAFCAINYQGLDGVIPLMPFAGIFAGALLVEGARLLKSARIIARDPNFVQLIAWLPLLALPFIIGPVASNAWRYRIDPGRSLDDQVKESQPVAELLGTDDKIYVHGTVEILVLLGRKNLNPYILLDRGKDKYIADRTAGGFEAIIAEMESQAPKIVSLHRLQSVRHRGELEQWAAEHYDKLPVGFAHDAVYVRKQQ